MTTGVTQEKRAGLKTNVASNEKASSVAVGNETVQEARKQQDVTKKDGLSPEQRRLGNLNKLIEKAVTYTKEGSKEDQIPLSYVVRYKIPRGLLQVERVNGGHFAGQFRVTLLTKDSNATETQKTAIIPADGKGKVEKIFRHVITANHKHNPIPSKWTIKESVSGEWADKFTDGLISDGLKVINKGVPIPIGKIQSH